MPETNPINMPWHVRTDGDTFVSGHEAESNAEQDRDGRNKQAEKLDLKTRYVVKPKP